MDDDELKRNRRIVSIAMIGTNMSVTNILSGRFRMLGYENIDFYRDVQALESAIFGLGFDLLLGDADLKNGALLDLLSGLSNSDIGWNPFAAVIVTSSSKEWTMVPMALANPISPDV